MSKRLCLASCCFFVAVICFASTRLPQLFQQAKEQFKQASYSEALKTLDEIGRRSTELENDKYRTASMTAALAFYRGACLAALGRNDEARAAFGAYLALQPNAQLDPNVYPERVIATFEETRRGLKKQLSDQQGSIAAQYEAFHYAGKIEQDIREDWLSGPVRNLMSAEERQAFAQLRDALSRRDFVAKFWASRDPTPETPENEFRQEFERRVAFADAHFSQDEERGSLTDRGVVFVLLGPPTYVGRQPIRTGQDTDPSGMRRYTRNDVVAVQKAAGSKTSSQATNAAVDKMTGPGNMAPEMSMRWRDVWHYRKELLPKTVGYQEVDFEFITREGYGDNVLQRDAVALNTLDAARKALQSATLNGSSQ